MTDEWGGKAIPLGSIVFDPYLIVTQIVLLQALYYLLLGVVLVVLQGVVLGEGATMDMVFSPSAQDPGFTSGILVAASHFLTSLLSAYSLLHVVGRSKKCLDFTATLFCLHTLASTLFSSFPTTASWWSLLLANLSAMSLISEYLCMKRELREISIQVCH